MDALLNITLKFRDGSAYVKQEPPSALTIGKPDLSEPFEMTVNIPSGTTNQAITLAPVDAAKVLYILTTASITVKFNSTGGEAHDIVADKLSDADTKYGILMGTLSGITSIYISNSSGDTAKVKIIAAN